MYKGQSWGRMEDFFHFFFVPNMFLFKFPMGFYYILNIFLRFFRCSPRVFPIAPRFNPICFAQRPPLLTYIGGLKGEAFHLSIEYSILGRFHNFNFFKDGPITLVHCQKKRVGLMKHLQLINMKQIKYPQFDTINITYCRL